MLSFRASLGVRGPKKGLCFLPLVRTFLVFGSRMSGICSFPKAKGVFTWVRTKCQGQGGSLTVEEVGEDIVGWVVLVEKLANFVRQLDVLHSNHLRRCNDFSEHLK
jgi:hypothetical protein